MNDHFENLREKIAVALIARWKRDESKLTAEYGSRENFFSDAMPKELFKDAKIRAEFGDNLETLKSYLQNESRAKSHKRDISTHKRPQSLDDDTTTDDATRTKWDADAALRNEFNGDYDSYLAWAQNRHRARVYNR